MVKRSLHSRKSSATKYTSLALYHLVDSLSVPLNHAMAFRNPERTRAAFFMCFSVLVVLLLRRWVNPPLIDNEEYGIIVGIVCSLRLRGSKGAQHSSDTNGPGSWRRQ